MRKETRCGPAVRIEQRRDWSVPLVAATVLGAALLVLLVLGLYDGGSAQARPTRAVLLAAGDIASCQSRGDRATAKLLDSISGTVLALGDEAYPAGTAKEFDECYDRTWGRFKDRTKPVPGNHEYMTPGAAGYFDYFGGTGARPSAPVPNTRENPGLTPSKGYYSYDRGAWHIVALNSECDSVRGGCDPTSPMLTWLEKDLAAHPDQCTLAYWHKPLFTSGYNGDYAPVRPIWDVLYAAHADVVLNGHDHFYERFARQTPRGERSKRGIREFVVGTGGGSHAKFVTDHANNQARNAHTYGVLKLTLRSRSYRWKFVPAGDKTFTDSGNTPCHN
jgi:acid phosphatase type 7